MLTGDQAALVIMVGAPASGKSTWVAGRFDHGDVYSLDDYRRKLSGRELDMDATESAVAMLHITVRWRMTNRRLTVIDSTNVRGDHRRPLVRYARYSGVPVLVVVMATPLAECQARNARRVVGAAVDGPYPAANGARVPRSAVARLHAQATGFPPKLGREADAILTIGARGEPVRWQGDLPLTVLAAPWLADTLRIPVVGEAP
jgi:predicted kinase